jgi:5''-3'' exonuclease
LYFKNVYEDYPEILIKHIEGNNNLFLDLNCAIHPCCKNIIDNYNTVKVNKEILEKKMINEVITYLKFILEKTNPNFLFVAIDGVAPTAKMTQQRLRRYKSVLDKQRIKDIKKKLNIEENKTVWDTNAISPGTIFMNKLSNAINSYLSSLKIKVIFSDSFIPGEGEHKILDYIKHNTIEGNTIIYGLDADLIMLAMVSRKNNIYLLRESVQFGKTDTSVLLYFDINLFKIKLLGKLRELIYEKDESYHIENHNLLRLIDDYIFICFLLGNDFLPHNLSVDLRYNGHDITT